MTDDALDTLLRQTDPYAGRSPLPDAAAREGSAALVDEVVTTTRRRRARLLGTRRRRLAAVSVAVLMAVPLGAVAKDRVLAHTGTYNMPSESGPGTSEFMAICADDYPAYLRSLPVPRMPLPPGVSTAELPDKLLAYQRRVALGCTAGNEYVLSADRVVAEFHEVAKVEWLCEAHKRQAAGDHAGAVAAGRQAADQIDALVAGGDYAGDWSGVTAPLRRGDLGNDHQQWAEAAIGCNA